MNRTHKFLNALCIIPALAVSVRVGACQAPQAQAFAEKVEVAGPAPALWRDRGDYASLNLIYGSGSKERSPTGKFTFVKEDKEATSPKFEIVDEQGVHWKAKLGQEVKSETAATRLVWAAGYFTDEDYYLPEVRVDKMPKLDRGSQFVSADGVVRDVRLERVIEGEKRIGNWNWFKNPLVGTKELDGLRIMMALINNWDLKEINNVIYEVPGESPRYLIGDLGAGFGQTGNSLVRSKSNLKDYQGTKFIQKIESASVDFFLSSRPFLPTALDVPNYLTRTKMQEVAKDIPRAHAKWLGQLLGQLSLEQIRDCFRAAGYSNEEVEGYAAAVQGRITDLKHL